MLLRTHLISRPIACLFLVLGAFALGGCVSSALTAGASVGSAALDDRGVDGVTRDTALAAEIRGKIIGEDFDKRTTTTLDVGVDVHERRVLLTGVVENEDVRAGVVAKTWEVNGVKTVLNEIRIGEGGLKDSARDAWITTRLRSKMTLDGDVSAVNYIISTVDSTVFLIGVAQSQAELDRVIGHARNIPRVREVVSHVRLKTLRELQGAAS